ncbi:hypothetical protein ACFVIM_16680 [Streptomyces sp. NPDC057638]|uniref:hypothetical protein n=1 Tax=Streptomyces sp. NPDC057638 TaxID=3346190 RepID=UPI003692785B
MTNETPGPGKDGLRGQYATQFAAELEKNETEQAHVRVQLAELDARLKQLQSDEGWLSRMLDTATTAAGERGAAQESQNGVVDDTASADVAPPAEAAATPAADTVSAEAAPRSEGETAKAAKPAKAVKATGVAKRATPAKGAAAVPKPRRSRESKPATGGRRSATSDATAATDATAGRATATAAAAPDAKPTLRAAVLELLRKTVEPRTAKEVAQEVAQAHAHLQTTVAVVRDALNAHVAKGRVQRETKQKAVWYSATADAVSGAPQADAGATAPAGAATA